MCCCGWCLLNLENTLVRVDGDRAAQFTVAMDFDVVVVDSFQFDQVLRPFSAPDVRIRAVNTRRSPEVVKLPDSGRPVVGHRPSWPSRRPWPTGRQSLPAGACRTVDDETVDHVAERVHPIEELDQFGSTVQIYELDPSQHCHRGPRVPAWHQRQRFQRRLADPRDATAVPADLRCQIEHHTRRQFGRLVCTEQQLHSISSLVCENVHQTASVHFNAFPM
ncbi:conserved hypothetical protein [Trichinella spiralis]|uniref:hypothetical protein n=1 Tax=Trichinella spiralis TaxID=6334 RepID=UPI0001EFDFF9|nr:conserved hypothetical protein [Trichinella spiralis]